MGTAIHTQTGDSIRAHHMRLVSGPLECGQLVSSLLDRILVNFYHCFSGVAQVCRDAAGK